MPSLVTLAICELSDAYVTPPTLEPLLSAVKASNLKDVLASKSRVTVEVLTFMLTPV